MPHLKTTILLFLLVVFSLAASVDAQDIKLIANPDVKTDSLSSSDVKDIFMGKKNRWDDGSKITFFTSKEVGTHEAFLKSYVGKSSTQYRKFWRNKVFAGKGMSPKSSGSDQEMVKLVAGTGGAIGYVSAGVDLGTVKTISVR